MVALSVGSILLAIGIPSVIELRASSMRYDARLQLESAVRRARSEAVAQGARSILRFSADGRGYSLGMDYLPYSETATEDIVASFETVPSRTAITLSSTAIFSSSGMLIDLAGDAASLTFELTYDGEAYCSGTIFSTGLVQFLC